MLAIILAGAAVGVATAKPAAKNMNGGGEYLIANHNPNSSRRFETAYPRRPTEEFFDVYAGPVSTRYGEVFWQGLPAVPLPEDIVSRFAGKAIAITGYEVDQVMVDNTTKDESTSSGFAEKSVPIYWAYNHHYVSWLKGKHATMVELDGTDTSVIGHPLLMNSVAIDDPNPSSAIPTSQFFSEGNGGEMRKSYHGYPKGFAQLLDSPTEFVMTPMQIDTWNRNTSYGDPFVPGPESTASGAPLTGRDAIYSGHLECPCTDRIVKTVVDTYATTSASQPHCGTAVSSAAKCFVAVSQVGVAQSDVATNATVSSDELPAGCSIFTTDGVKYTATFNTKTSSSAKCGASSSGKSGKPHMAGVAHSVVSFEAQLDAGTSLATLTLSGPAAVWFGVGLGAAVMKDTPNAIIVLGNGTVFEQKLADQQAGHKLPNSLTVVSNVVKAGVRTVVVTRPLKGKTAEHYTFDMANPLIKFINAVGRGPAFAYHAKRAASTLNLKVVGANTCICNTGEKGFIHSDMNPNPQPFHKSCRAEPAGDLLAKKNPTCTLQQYSGGLSCCKSHNILLDKHQNPWPDNILSYFMKYRFWFEDFVPATSTTPASHQNLVRFFKETEADAGEYDVVKAPTGTKPEDTVYEITAHFQTKDGMKMCDPRTSPHCTGVDSSGTKLMYASCHCHAPSCLGCELWNADTGELICRQTPVYGNSPAATNETNKYDEQGYVAIPPCLFGDEADGLMPPPYLKYDQNLTAIKRNNNTYDHYGEMAMWQMRGAQAYEPAVH